MNSDGRPVLLDLFCGAGGCAAGYHRAGFTVVGVDLERQQNYPFEFHRGDAIEALREIVEQGGEFRGHRIAAVHASPPCQANSDLRNLWPGREYVELIPPTREVLLELGLPYVIENVPGAALIEPFTLCGSMFGNGANGRQLRRHRLFEANFPVMVQLCQHRGQSIGVYGHPGNSGEADPAKGYKGTAEEYAAALEMPWATAAEIAQAIPPSYTQFIGGYLMQTVERERVAA